MLGTAKTTQVPIANPPPKKTSTAIPAARILPILLIVHINLSIIILTVLTVSFSTLFDDACYCRGTDYDSAKNNRY